MASGHQFAPNSHRKIVFMSLHLSCVSFSSLQSVQTHQANTRFVRPDRSGPFPSIQTPHPPRWVGGGASGEAGQGDSVSLAAGSALGVTVTCHEKYTLMGVCERDCEIRLSFDPHLLGEQVLTSSTSPGACTTGVEHGRYASAGGGAPSFISFTLSVRTTCRMGTALSSHDV